MLFVSSIIGKKKKPVRFLTWKIPRFLGQRFLSLSTWQRIAGYYTTTKLHPPYHKANPCLFEVPWCLILKIFLQTVAKITIVWWCFMVLFGQTMALFTMATLFQSPCPAVSRHQVLHGSENGWYPQLSSILLLGFSMKWTIQLPGTPMTVEIWNLHLLLVSHHHFTILETSICYWFPIIVSHVVTCSPIFSHYFDTSIWQIPLQY